jgi:hypothetical protein
MIAAHVFTPENRLAKVLASLEGRSKQELVHSAEARAARLQGAIRTYVGEKLERLMAYSAMREEELFAESRELGAHALDVAEVAGAGGLHAVGEIARGITAMIDNLVRRGIWHTDALRLHLDTLALINLRAGASPYDDIVLSRLRSMRSAIGVVE